MARLKGFYVKLVLMAVVDALGVYGLWTLAGNRAWLPFAIMLVGLSAVNIAYFTPRLRASKYLIPGLVFLLVYQVYSVLFSAYIAFTNYGDGHNSTKSDAIAALLQQTEVRAPNSAEYPLSIGVQGSRIAFLVIDPATSKPEIGTATQPLAPAPAATVAAGRVSAYPGWHILNLAEMLDRGSAFTRQVTATRVPISSQPGSGSIQTQDGTTAYQFVSVLVYDRAQDTMTNTQTHVVYHDSGRGSFVSADGTALSPGWRVTVGFANFTSVVTNQSLRAPFFGVVVWTFAFAVLVVVISFVLGLFLAVVLNDPRMRGRKIYRSLLILPYAFPAFLSALIWQGLLNRDFGFVNQILLGGATVDWLGNPWLARGSVILVNVWLTFPYMFLVATGALQSMPADVLEASAIDGASPFQIMRKIKLPLLMVSLAPLLITSFAFNFNNFNTIYMLTKGGPQELQYNVDVGSTDILITFVYKLAFGGTNKQYGLASAIAIMIFVVIALVSAAGFRRARSLEDVN